MSDSTAEYAEDWWSDWSDAKFFDIIFTQRATRIYKPVEIDQAVLGKILRAATFAPSATNTQPWDFLAVKDRDLKARLQEMARKTYEAADAQRGHVATRDGTGRLVTGRASVDNMVNASALVLVFWNPDRGIRIKNQYVENPDGTLTETNHIGSGRGASIFQACQNMTLAAQALGVQSIFTHALCDAQREVKELLGVPPRMFLEAVIYLGYGDERLGRPRRKALTEVAHLDHWDAYWPEDSTQQPT